MNFSSLIKSRHSIRRFSSKPLERKKIEQCLEAARLAPSAQNSQPWVFHVIHSEKARKEFSKKCFSGIYSPSAFAGKAGALILCTADLSFFTHIVGKQIQGVPFHLLDMGIAGEHLVLQARDLGIGSCWIGWYNTKAAGKILHVPKTSKMICLIALGYGMKNSSVRRHKRKPMNKIIHQWI